MGRASRPKPSLLSRKLLEIRSALGLSQNGMIRRMGLSDKLTQAEISAFERGIRTPPLPVLLRYARSAGLYVDALIDDDVDLPEELPSPVPHAGVLRERPLKKRGRGLKV
jgi:transcriptional regulator with XRE-family HTH domain